MSVLDIAKVGNPVLRTPARTVSREELADEELQQLIDDMIDTMREAKGAGIAANQVHRPVRIAIAEVASNSRYPYKPPIPLTVFVNPVLVPLDDEVVRINEGCLSVPDLRGDLDRFVNVEVRFWDRAGEEQVQQHRGLTAGTFQHECDHLLGRLFLDRVTDTTTFSTWSEFEQHHRAAFLERISHLAKEP